MKKIRRRLIPIIATFAALGCLFAGPVSAQPLLATTGVAPDACGNPIESSCSRGTLSVVNGATLDVQSSLTLWQGVANRFLQKLVVHPGGMFLYAAQSLGRPTPTSRWIDVIDLRTMTQVTTYNVTGNLATISPDGTRLYLTTSREVLVLDSATGSVLSSIPVLSSALAITPDGARIYLAGGTSQAPRITMAD